MARADILLGEYPGVVVVYPGPAGAEALPKPPRERPREESLATPADEVDSSRTCERSWLIALEEVEVARRDVVWAAGGG